MTQKIIYAIYPESECVVQKFMERLQLAEIQTRQIKSSDKYQCLESTWDDDTEIPKPLLKNPRNAGAKLKDLKYNGKSVNCGSVYLLKFQKHFSNSEIAQLFNVSESTINRRIKRHFADGNFHADSKVIF